MLNYYLNPEFSHLKNFSLPIINTTTQSSTTTTTNKPHPLSQWSPSSKVSTTSLRLFSRPPLVLPRRPTRRSPRTATPPSPPGMSPHLRSKQQHTNIFISVNAAGSAISDKADEKQHEGSANLHKEAAKQ